MPSDLLYRLRALFRRKTVETELDEELRFHLEHQVKEEYRDTRGTRWIKNFRKDLLYATRTLRGSPGLSAVASLPWAWKLRMARKTWPD